MISEAKARQLVDLAVSHAGRRASGTEVTISSTSVATSRFANNDMTQNQAPERTEISLRVIRNGRQCRLVSDNLTPGAIRKLVDDAIAATAFLEPDPALLQLPRPGRQNKPVNRQVNRYNRRTAALSAADRAAAVARITQIARGEGLLAAGVVATGSTLICTGNSRGLFASHKETSAECSVTMTAGSGTGWSKATYPSFSELDCESLARRAAAKAKANADAAEIAPGRYTVILEPSAVLDLLCFLWHDFAATSHIDKLSCFLGKTGKRVLGENITIWDDVYHPDQAGAPFDGEGLARQRVCLVDSGKISGLVYGRRSAQELGTAPTGHGLAEPNTEGEMPLNLVVAGGETSVDEMIGSTERGVLLTRVWYVREVDPTLKIVTGMTRDGTFLVEGGKMAGAVKNLRFNQGLIEMLNNVIALGPAVRAAGEESFPAVVPAMKVEGFNFASTTTF